MTDEELLKSMEKLNQNLNKHNVQQTLDEINDLYGCDYPLQDDSLYDLFNYHNNILSYSEAYGSLQDDDDPANRKDIMKEDEDALRWMDNHDDLSFVHWTDVKDPITVKDARRILNSIIDYLQFSILFDKVH